MAKTHLDQSDVELLEVAPHGLPQIFPHRCKPLHKTTLVPLGGTSDVLMIAILLPDSSICL
jgi:hypothetical protein